MINFIKKPNSYELKKKLAKTYFISFLLAIVTFYWHNEYCTDYGKYFKNYFEKFLKNKNSVLMTFTFFICLSFHSS